MQNYLDAKVSHTDLSRHEGRYLDTKAGYTELEAKVVYAELNTKIGYRTI